MSLLLTSSTKMIRLKSFFCGKNLLSKCVDVGVGPSNAENLRQSRFFATTAVNRKTKSKREKVVRELSH